MSRSQSLRLRDIRAVVRLLGECRDLACDFVAWHEHLLRELTRLTGGQVGCGVEGVRRGPDHVQATRFVDTGWTDSSHRDTLVQFMQSEEYNRGPLAWRKAYRLGTWSRQQIMDDGMWYRSRVFNEFISIASLDDNLCSLAAYPLAKAQDFIGLWRPRGKGLFSERERRLVQLFHEELRPLLGTYLATSADPAPSDLTRRLQEVLACLLEGDSEKQIAIRLVLSPFTVHEYVKRVYLHFGANSRPELMAYFLRKTRAGTWPLRDGPADRRL